MRRIALVLVAILSCSTTWSLESDPTLQQLNDRIYTAADGTPSDVRALAQTTDGTLWVGSSTGLSRFDGTRLIDYPESGNEPLPSSNISALIASNDGGLWIGFRLGGVSFLKAGHLTHYQTRDGLPDGTVWQFAWDHDGALWLAASGGLARLQGGRWARIATDAVKTTTNHRILAVLEDRARTLWVLRDDRLLARVAGEFREMARVDLAIDSQGSLVMAPDGSVWFGTTTEGGVVTRMRSPLDPQASGNRALRLTGVRPPLLFDGEGNLWLRKRGNTGLMRLPSRELTADGNPAEILARAEEFSFSSSPADGHVHVIFEDRENNIWVGYDNRIDRISRSNVVRAPSLPLCDGLGNAFVAGEAGTLWGACGRNDTITGVLAEIHNGSLVSQRETGNFTAAYRDAEGTLWFGGPSGLGSLDKNGQIITVPLPEYLGRYDVQAIVRDRSGALWVSVVRKGVFRFSGNEWSAYGGLDTNAMPRGPAIVETADTAGTLWFGYPNNRVTRLEGRTAQTFDATSGLKVGNVTAIHAQGKQLWVGGDLGLMRFDKTRFVPILSACGKPFTVISGIVTARNGDLWLNAIGGIVHIPHAEIERSVQDPGYPVQCETFDYLDGVPGTPHQLRPTPSVIETTDGLIWFSTDGGLISIDPTRLIRNTVAPPVTIWAVSSAGKRYPNVGADLHLPIHTTNLQIDYTAGSLTIPERVHFRYQLEGSDGDWQDVGNRREALYTNLGPGQYTFRVIAANNDGVWNRDGASLQFTIVPAFYQTKWFYALCVVAFLGALFCLHRLRLQQVRAQTSRVLEAQLTERERIARELHDTLLQGVQGLIWRFQAVADRISHRDPARNLLEQALDRADQVLEESRNRVKDLRDSEAGAGDLPQALAAEGERLAQEHAAEFRTSVEGVPRDVHPIAREEALHIAREALGNAFRHADARHIEAEVSYSEAALHVRVRDDGRGIVPDVLEAGGKHGHFGLLGMRERANKIRARLQIWSKPGGGTEVELCIPADVAYRRSQTAIRRRRLWRDIVRSSGGRR